MGFSLGLLAVFPVIFGLMFLLIVGVILFAIFKSVTTAMANNAAPVEAVEAKVVTKRTTTSGGGGDSMVSTRQYVTFETLDGNRREFSVPGREYGLLAEGDQGTLNVQGTRYNNFQRHLGAQ